MKRITQVFVFLNLFFLSFPLFAFGEQPMAQTQGYWSPIYPGSQFWPQAKVSLPGYGTVAQQQNIATNPDQFCASQGEGWPLPSLADINYSGYSIGPGFATLNNKTGRKFGAYFGGFRTSNQTPAYANEKNIPNHAANQIFDITTTPIVSNTNSIGLGYQESLHPSNFWNSKNMTQPKLDLTVDRVSVALVPNSLGVVGTLGELFLGLQIEDKTQNGLGLGYGSVIDSTSLITFPSTLTSTLLPLGFHPALFDEVINGRVPKVQYWLAEVTSPEMLPAGTSVNVSAEPNRAIVYVEKDPSFSYRNMFYTGSLSPTETANIICVKQYY